MIISNNDYDNIKKLILDAYFMARDCDAFFIMENLDIAMSILQSAERKESIKKQKYNK